MNAPRLGRAASLAAAAVCTATATTLALWVQIPTLCLAGIAVLGAICVAALLSSAQASPPARIALLIVAWLISVAMCWALGKTPGLFGDLYFGVVGLLISCAVLFSAAPMAEKERRGWGWLGMTWAGLGILGWVAGAYSQNAAALFYCGWFSVLLLAYFGKKSLRPPAMGVLVINTLMVAIVGLPLADLLFGQGKATERTDANIRTRYSYDAAKRDPAAFGRWWRLYLDEWDRMAKDVFSPDPTGTVPVHLKPGAVGHLFQSRISINRLGFRGPDFEPDKHDVYRIVALGESTTFGCTLQSDDKPWPEVLEETIHGWLDCQRPVQVINAGVPALSLKHNLHRLETEILPLKPDLIISYHGVNGFRMLDQALPSIHGKAPPVYHARPLKLLADAEYRLRILRYRKGLNSTSREHPAELRDVMGSSYADAYRELTRILQTNHVRLALADFSMAVNGQSAPGPIEFYGSMFPSVPWLIRANEAHSAMVRTLVAENPEVCFVDTHPHLDGQHEKFIDLVHLTQSGREQLAENVFKGIQEILVREVCRKD